MITDNEIIEALKCCMGSGKCGDCPLEKRCEKDIHACEKLTIDLIETRKAEIERYLNSIRLLEQDVKAAREELAKFKAMTVDGVAKMGARAFAERLQKRIVLDLCEVIDCSKYLDEDLPEIIDSLVEKMAGDKNAEV